MRCWNRGAEENSHVLGRRFLTELYYCASLLVDVSRHYCTRATIEFDVVICVMPPDAPGNEVKAESKGFAPWASADPCRFMSS
jgi:hypothetical protein